MGQPAVPVPVPAPDRAGISAAVHDLGWRYVLGALCTAVPVAGLAQAAGLAAALAAVAAPPADRGLRLDLRADRVLITLAPPEPAGITGAHLALVRDLTAEVRRAGRDTEPGTGDGTGRSVQQLEIAIDALDIAAIRPFWRAVLGYRDEAGPADPTGALVDPYRQGPAVWFQAMDAPRPQRNRIHLDVSVPHDEVPARLSAALAAGGALVSRAQAPAFWVLADVEGNEACLSTWQGRDG